MLIGKQKDSEPGSLALKIREGVRSAGVQKHMLKSAEPNVGKIEKLKLYREPNEDYTNNIEKIREYKQKALLIAYGAHESNTPQKEKESRPSFLISHQSSQKYLLPSIQSTKASDTGANSAKL